jgi:hypothetical protein
VIVVFVWTPTGILGDLSTARLAVVPAAASQGHQGLRAVPERESNFREERSVELGPIREERANVVAGLRPETVIGWRHGFIVRV